MVFSTSQIYSTVKLICSWLSVRSRIQLSGTLYIHIYIYIYIYLFSAQKCNVYKIPIIYSAKFRESQNLPGIKNSHLRCPFLRCEGLPSNKCCQCLANSIIVSIGHKNSEKLRHNKNSTKYTTDKEIRGNATGT
jgi:hypothetical protein